MGALTRLYDTVIVALPAIAGVMLVVSFVLIVYDVLLRNVLLISPPAFSVPSIEYGLLYITMFCGPWLVRTRGHVSVEALRQASCRAGGSSTPARPGRGAPAGCPPW